MAMFKDAWTRQEKYGRDDDEQRSKAGYFDKMKDVARKVYDDKEAEMRKKRGDQNAKFDKFRDDEKVKQGYDKMDGAKKMAFLKKMQGMRGQNDDARLKARSEDDLKRMKTDYYNRSPENR